MRQKFVAIVFAAVFLLAPLSFAETESVKIFPARNDIRAAYLSIDNIHNSSKISYIENLIAATELNAVVIDFKVGKPQTDDYLRKLVERFKKKNIYVIGRLVTFQDTYYATKVRPDLALRIPAGNACGFKAGSFWYSGRESWMRYWLDMSSPEVQAYNIKVAKDGIDIGFDEINFDYIRFPSDGPNCWGSDSNGKKKLLSVSPSYPVWDGSKSKEQVMEAFFEKVRKELKAYNPKIVLSVDIYGYVFLRGVEPGVAQNLLAVSKNFDVISPMAYPSHYACNEFGARDPNAIPFKVYDETLKTGLLILKKNNIDVVVRPWVQDFSITSIYSCGGKINYGVDKVKAQIDAVKSHGIYGYMLWNSSSNYTQGALSPR